MRAKNRPFFLDFAYSRRLFFTHALFGSYRKVSMNRVFSQTTQTDPKLIDRLKESARQPKTKKQRFAQRVSFVYGNQPKEMTFTREEVEKQLRNMD